MGRASRDKGMRCIIHGCQGRPVGRGYCRKHYTRVRRYGSPYACHKPGEINQIRQEPRKIDFFIDENGCFICSSHSLDKDGYPKIQVSHKPYRMSRFIYEQCFGEIPKGHVVRHTCDNPSCINPEHLLTGTHADNARDKVERGRVARRPGESNPMAKLTERDVQEIKKLLDTGLTTTRVAQMFNVSRKTVANIKNGKSWKHLA